MRLLFLTSRLPYPPDRGDRVRTYHFLRYLGQEHEVTLVSFVDGRRAAEEARHLRPFCRDVHLVPWPPWRAAVAVALGAWRGLPLQLLYYRSRAMKRLVDQLLGSGQFQGVYVHLFRMAPYVERWRGLYRVVDLTDVISSEVAASLAYRPALSRAIYTLEQPRIAACERRVAQWADEVWLISDQEKQKLAAVAPSARIAIVPSGIAQPQPGSVEPGKESLSLLFIGHLAVWHNVDAVQYLVQKILPLIRQQVPAARLAIAGAGAGRRVLLLADEPGVELLGYVADLGPLLTRSAVFLAPLRFAAGIQQKVLEAMAAGLPVVATEQVNRGLGAQPGREILLADDARGLAMHAVNLLRNSEQRQAVGESGRRFVHSRYTWQTAVERWAQIESLLRARP